MVNALQRSPISVAEERCVRVRNRNASCRKCVDACLADAITLGDNELAVDAALCVNCGACLPVCPTSALIGTNPWAEDVLASAFQVLEGGLDTLVVACARMAARNPLDPHRALEVPCLGRIDEAFLLTLARQGVTDSILVDGECATCKYGKVSPGIDCSVENAGALTVAAGVHINIKRTSILPDEVCADDISRIRGEQRRQLFASAGTSAKRAALHTAEMKMDEVLQQRKEQKLLTLRERLGAGKSGRIPPFEATRNLDILDNLWKCAEQGGEQALDRLTQSPNVFDSRLFGSVSIDTNKCSGCNMCVTFCPTAALKESHVVEHPDEGMRYVEFQAADCVQCGLCVDVCLRDCIKLSTQVELKELFDFEPRLIEMPTQKRGAALFSHTLLTS